MEVIEVAPDRGDKHGPRLDDEMAAEDEAIVRTGHSAHAEEWRESEPAGEDQPDVDLSPNTGLHGGTPLGMSEDDVEGRSELARFLRRSAFPTDARSLVAELTRIADQLERDPARFVFGDRREGYKPQ